MTTQELSDLMKSGFDAVNKRLDGIDKRFDGIDSRFRNVETDVSWIKGKMEGKAEGGGKMLSIITVCTAVGAVILALVALFVK